MNISEVPDAGRRNHRKRANDCLMDDAEINCEPHTKISKISTNATGIYIKLADEVLPERVCDSDDSTYDSFHGRETDLCRDTSDTDDYSSDEEREISMAVVEYEIASSNESTTDTDALSSSGTDDFIAAVAQAICDDVSMSSPSDFSLFADTEDSDSTSDDPELGKADYWECVKCKNRQNNPLYRYCEKCYQIRKNLFPPRPKKNRKARLSQIPGIHKGHHRENSTVFGGKAKTDFSYMRENSVMGRVSKVNRTKSKDTNSAGESGKSDDSDTEYHQNDKIINFLTKSPKMSKRRKRLSNRKLTNNTTKTDNSSSELGETSKNFIVLLNNSSTMTATNRLTTNAINVDQQSSSSKTTVSNSNNNSSQISNRKRTCDSNNASAQEDVGGENDKMTKRFRLDSQNEIKTMHNKMFKNVIENWSGNSDTDSGDTIKLTPPNELDLINSCNKDSGFSSSSSQELSPVLTTQEFLNDKITIDNSSQETYCTELEIDETTPVTQVYATSSESALSNVSSSSAKLELLSRSASSCSGFTEIVSTLKSQDSLERTQNSEGFEMCMMCLTEPKNGVFVHNRFLHSCCCYKCAMKVWAKLKRCPICNCKYANCPSRPRRQIPELKCTSSYLDNTIFK